MGSCIWQNERQLWADRNTHQHHSLDSEQRTATHREIQRRVKIMYKYQHDTALARLRPTMYRHNLELFLQSPLPVLKKWIQVFEPIIRMHIRRTERNRSQGLQ